VRSANNLLRRITVHRQRGRCLRWRRFRPDPEGGVSPGGCMGTFRTSATTPTSCFLIRRSSMRP